MSFYAAVKRSSIMLAETLGNKNVILVCFKGQIGRF